MPTKPQTQLLYARILDHMSDHDRQTVAQVAKAIGEPDRRVTQAMADMAKNCRVYKVDKFVERQNRSTVYSLIKPVRVIISPRYVPQFRALDIAGYDMFAARNLALVGR